MRYSSSSTTASALIAVSLLLSAPAAQAQFTFFDDNGTAAAITDTRDAFRTAVGGGAVAGANGSFGGVRREINWDGVPDGFSDTNPFPANFFNVNSPRGAVFSTPSPGTGFLVSSTVASGIPIRFGFPNDFIPFSSQRLFAPVNSTITDVFFFVPGTTTAATTTAFAAIFSDVEITNSTSISFFDANDNLLVTRNALTGASGDLTFLGVQTTGTPFARVRINSGDAALLSNGIFTTGADGVVMDDFLYAEPTAIAAPEPGTLALLAAGILPFAALALRRRK